MDFIKGIPKELEGGLENIKTKATGLLGGHSKGRQPGHRPPTKGRIEPRKSPTETPFNVAPRPQKTN
jgi:hypothetical protein